MTTNSNVVIDPHNLDGAWQSIKQQAETLFEQGRLSEALACLDSLPPHAARTPTWHHGRGVILTGLGRFEEALQCYEHTLLVDPNHAQSLFNRAAILFDHRHYECALDGLDAAYRLEPDAWGLRGACWLARRHLSQWDDTSQVLVDEIAEGVQSGEATAEPYTVLVLSDDPQLQRKSASLWHTKLQTFARSPALVGHGTKLRIGYFSNDFYNHATLHLLAGVLEAHDRSVVEVVCFSWGPRTGDAYQLRAIEAADAFIEVHELTDVEVADKARELGLDIAIDLKGATYGARPGIFAARAAPVQVNYLGYPGTLGLSWWDYIVADAVVAPAESSNNFSEKIAHLPHCYQPNDTARIRPTEVPTRASCGLPQDAVVLASFNARHKLGPETFELWLEILWKVPHAVLWLLEGRETSQQNLCTQAKAYGVDPGRLVFAPMLPQTQHLARLPLADLMLDTLICNAHTTASDALWMGVPLITVAGRSFAARVAASALHAVGQSELVCVDTAAYVALAVDLANDTKRLQSLRQHLLRSNTPLFDTARYTRNLEAAWGAMCRRHRRGLPPVGFSVQEATLKPCYNFGLSVVDNESIA